MVLEQLGPELIEGVWLVVGLEGNTCLLKSRSLVSQALPATPLFCLLATPPSCMSLVMPREAEWIMGLVATPTPS